MIRSIVQVGDPILFEIASVVQDIQHADTKKVIQDLKDTLANTGRGVGLAAPQVGESVRIFLIHPRSTANYPDQQDEGYTIVINPEILDRSDEKVSGYEGCLSVSSQNGEGMMRVIVPRNVRIDVKYTSESGKIVERRFEGFGAIIFQHEYDHLEGVLFLERVEDRKSLRSDR